MPALVAPLIPPGGLRRHRQPVLRVEELVLRPWAPADVPGVVAAYGDAEIQRWHVQTMTDDEAADWVGSWSRRWAGETDAGWAITDSGGLVGRVGFNFLDLSAGLGAAAYWVRPSARGRNIAARALTAVTDWMFTQVGFHRMSLQHSTRNQPSCRVAEKAGYAYEGTARGLGRHVDGWHDMHVHARIRA